MFESKLNKLIRKLPRSHIFVLRCVQKWYIRIDFRDANSLSETSLLKIYNKEMTSEMCAEKISVGQLFDLCMYLNECNILQVVDKSTTSNKIKGGFKQPLMLTKKRVTGSKAIGKSFNIELAVDLQELTDALERIDNNQVAEKE